MVKLMRTPMVQDLLVTELRLGESGSQRSYILVLVKNVVTVTVEAPARQMQLLPRNKQANTRNYYT